MSQPRRLSSTTFFFLETSTGVSVSRVSRVSGWDPSGFPEKMGYHEFTGAGVAGGESEGESEGFDGLLAFLPHLLPDVDRWPGALPHRLDGTGIQ